MCIIQASSFGFGPYKLPSETGGKGARGVKLADARRSSPHSPIPFWGLVSDFSPKFRVELWAGIDGEFRLLLEPYCSKEPCRFLPRAAIKCHKMKETPPWPIEARELKHFLRSLNPQNPRPPPLQLSRAWQSLKPPPTSMKHSGVILKAVLRIPAANLFLVVEVAAVLS